MNDLAVIAPNIPPCGLSDAATVIRAIGRSAPGRRPRARRTDGRCVASPAPTHPRRCGTPGQPPSAGPPARSGSSGSPIQLPRQQPADATCNRPQPELTPRRCRNLAARFPVPNGRRQRDRPKCLRPAARPAFRRPNCPDAKLNSKYPTVLPDAHLRPPGSGSIVRSASRSKCIVPPGPRETIGASWSLQSRASRKRAKRDR